MEEIDFDPDNDGWMEQPEKMQSKWLAKVTKYRPVIQLILHHCPGARLGGHVLAQLNKNRCVFVCTQAWIQTAI